MFDTHDKEGILQVSRVYSKFLVLYYKYLPALLLNGLIALVTSVATYDSSSAASKLVHVNSQCTYLYMNS